MPVPPANPLLHQPPLRWDRAPGRTVRYLSTTTTPGGGTLVHCQRVMEAVGAQNRAEANFRKLVMQRLERLGYVQASGRSYRITRAGLIEAQRLMLTEAAEQANAQRVRRGEQQKLQRHSRTQLAAERYAQLADQTRMGAGVHGPRHGYVAGGAAQLPDRPRRDGLQHETLPSRRGNELYYRDGRVVPVPAEARVAAVAQPQPGASLPPRRLRAWELQQLAQAQPSATQHQPAAA